MLSLLESSETSASPSIEIFQWNNTSSKHVRFKYIEIRRISSIRKYRTEDAAKKLVNSCILVGYPQTVIKPLKQVQNSAAKLILKHHRAEHAKPLLKQLHWLPWNRESNMA